MPCAVITGASGGIGAELARRLCASGWAVVLVARRAAELHAVVASLPAGRAHGVVGDMTRRADVERASAEAIAAFGGYEVWVNNVGLGIAKHVLELTEADVDAILAANLKSSLWGMQVAVAHFTAAADGRGHVVNISSFLGRVPMSPLRSIYSAAKAALGSLSSNLRMDLAAAGLGERVFCTTVLPGLVFTDFSKNAIGSTGGASSSGAVGQSVEAAVAPMVALIEAARAGTVPPAELYTQGAVQHDAAVRYVADPAAVEAAAVARKPAA